MRYLRGLIDLIPAGCVFAYAAPTPPDGYLECDGSAISRVVYKDLFDVIGETYGNGDGSTTFNLPDYRGEFLRGWDHGAGNDPDAGTRTDRGDTVSGDYVGTKQDDDFKSHRHVIGYPWLEGQPNKNMKPDSGDANANDPRSTEYTGGNETRPRNIYVMYIIKY